MEGVWVSGIRRPTILYLVHMFKTFDVFYCSMILDILHISINGTLTFNLGGFYNILKTPEICFFKNYEYLDYYLNDSKYFIANI